MRIGIFSRGPGLYSTQRLVEAGELRGHDVRVIDHAACSPYLENGRSILLTGGNVPLDDFDVFIPRIGANVTQRGAAILRQLAVMGLPHTLSAAALLRARDKMACLQHLVAHRLPVPRTILCFSPTDARRAAKRMGPFPVVVKLLESTHGVGVALARNTYQMERMVEGFLQFQDRVMVQEYIRESNGSDIRAFVVGNRIVATMARSAGAGEFRANLHRGGSAEIVELSKEERRVALAAAASCGVEVAGVDLLRSRRGPLLMEINASPGLEGIEGVTGVDVAGAIVEYALEKIERNE